MLLWHQVETGFCSIYSSSSEGFTLQTDSSACFLSHATCEKCEVAALGVSPRVNCIINPQAVKRQAWMEFTLEPSLSHRHNLALCTRVSDMSLLINPQPYLRENVITQIFGSQLPSRDFFQADMSACGSSSSLFHFLSHVFFCVWVGGGQCHAPKTADVAEDFSL